VLPDNLKQSPYDMYWMMELSGYHRAKIMLQKYSSGEIDVASLTPNKLRSLLISSGESKKEADKQAAKFHLESTRK
jgi:hypothetical protein